MSSSNTSSAWGSFSTCCPSVLLTGSHGYKAWTSGVLYGRSSSSFLIVAADDFEMPISCARRLSDFCGVCCNLASISSSFFLISTRRFLACFLSRCHPVNTILLISSWMPLCAWKFVPEKFTTKFSQTRCSTLYQTISTHTTITSRYLTWLRAQLHLSEKF
jgi:hypothetical protein